MKTIANHIYTERYQAIKNIVQAIQAGDHQTAEALAESVLKTIPSRETTPETIQTLFFMEALNKRLEKQASQTGNLYLMPDQGQQIKMFNFMAEKFPLVRFSQDLVNQTYLREIKGKQNSVILDIGIGTGQQMVRLLNDLAKQNCLPQKLTIIGIEPAQESLRKAQEDLSTFAQQHPIEFRFEAIPQAVEKLTESDWQALENSIREAQGQLIINASFALHHIRPTHIRAELFMHLKAFQPDIIGILEPYADFLTSQLLERFSNAWHHYGLTFRAIDKIEASTEEKTAVKTAFFSREIQDVLAEEPQRVEQFETGEMWSERLIQAGFTLQPIDTSSLNGTDCPFITVTRNPNYIGLDVEGYPIISILIGR